MRLRSAARTPPSGGGYVGSSPAVAANPHADVDELLYQFMGKAAGRGDIDKAADIYSIIWKIKRERKLRTGRQEA